MSGIDRAGVVASSACAIHCAVGALLPGVLSAVGLTMLLSHEAEWALTAVAVAFAGAALLVGWRRHRSTAVAGALAGGIVGLVAARLVEEAGVHGLGMALALIGGAILVAGHIANIRATRRATAS